MRYVLFQARTDLFYLPAESLPSEHPYGLLSHIPLIEEPIDFQVMVELFNEHAHHSVL
jgi:hypothetical protein